ncbi:cupin domain protein [Xylogone sp. PMI_703]|nr:cupin domain protein [Xylogone sp. PMI_703]
MSSLEYIYDPKSPLADLNIAFQYELVNCPGKTIVGMLVEYGPGGATPPHRHGGASVTGYVLSGRVYNRMNDGPLEVKHTGETWYEAPGCHHVVSANYSNFEPAAIFAIFVVETEVITQGGLAALTVFDEEYRYLGRKTPAGQ